ncbi:MAG: nicotinate (nicotinamide) nucleotide adenylyltransferase [Clostridia bacterium]|nr:nicotinate (nicotinamide) nucleotide adenylyltransferase [Clostridia bacterium]
MKKIGIYGGSFDPVHKGHVNLANCALSELSLEKVIIMPSYIQPFKRDNRFTAPSDRVNMLKLSFDNPKIEISTYEIDKEDISYTFDTMSYLKGQYGDSELVFIVGTDSYLGIEGWYKGLDLLQNFSFAVATRPGYEADLEEKAKYYSDEYDTVTYILHNTVLAVSSSEIRKNVADGKNISELVNEKVEEYIRIEGLYRN